MKKRSGTIQWFLVPALRSGHLPTWQQQFATGPGRNNEVRARGIPKNSDLDHF